MVTPLYASRWLQSVEHLAKLVQEADLAVSANKEKLGVVRGHAWTEGSDTATVIAAVQDEQEKALLLLQRASHYVYEVLGEFSAEKEAQENALRRREAAIESVRDSMTSFFAAQAEVLEVELSHFEAMLGEERQRSSHRLKLLYANFCWRRAQRTQKACLEQWRNRLQRVRANRQRCISDEEVRLDAISSTSISRKASISWRDAATEVEWNEISLVDAGQRFHDGNERRSDSQWVPQHCCQRGTDPTPEKNRKAEETERPSRMMIESSPPPPTSVDAAGRAVKVLRLKHAAHIQKMRNYYRAQRKMMWSRVSRCSYLAAVEWRKAKQTERDVYSALVCCLKRRQNRDNLLMEYSMRKAEEFVTSAVVTLQQLRRVNGRPQHQPSEVTQTQGSSRQILNHTATHPTEMTLTTSCSKCVVSTDLLSAKKFFFHWLAYTLLSERRRTFERGRASNSSPITQVREPAITPPSPSALADSESSDVITTSPSCLSTSFAGSPMKAKEDCERCWLRIAALQADEEAGRWMLWEQRDNWCCEILFRQLSYFRESMPGIVQERKALAKICAQWERHCTEEREKTAKAMRDQSMRCATGLRKKSNKMLLRECFMKWVCANSRRYVIARQYRLNALEVHALSEKHATWTACLTSLLEKYRWHVTSVFRITQTEQERRIGLYHVEKNVCEEEWWKVKKQSAAMRCFLKWQLWTTQKQKSRLAFYERFKSLILQCESLSRRCMEQKVQWVVESFIACNAVLREECQVCLLKSQSEKDDHIQQLKHLEDQEHERIQLHSRQWAEALVELQKAHEREAGANIRAATLKNFYSEVTWRYSIHMESVFDKVQRHVQLISVLFTDSVSQLPMCKWLCSRQIQYRQKKQKRYAASTAIGGASNGMLDVGASTKRGSPFTVPANIAALLSYRFTEESLNYVELSRISSSELLSEYDLALLVQARGHPLLLQSCPSTNTQVYPPGEENKKRGNCSDIVTVPLVLSERILRFLSASLLSAFHTDHHKREAWRAAVWSVLLRQQSAAPKSYEVAVQHQGHCPLMNTHAQGIERSTQTPAPATRPEAVTLQGSMPVSSLLCSDEGADGARLRRLNEGDLPMVSPKSDGSAEVRRLNCERRAKFLCVTKKLEELHHSKRMALEQLRRACAIVVLQREALFHVAMINLSNVEAYQRLVLASQFECTMSRYYMKFSQTCREIDRISSEERCTAAEMDAREWSVKANKWRVRYLSFQSAVSEEMAKQREHMQLRIASAEKQWSCAEAASVTRVSALLQEQIRSTRLLSYSARLFSWMEVLLSLSTQIQTRKVSWFTLSAFQTLNESYLQVRNEPVILTGCSSAQVGLEWMDWYRLQLGALLDLRSSLLTLSFTQHVSGDVHRQVPPSSSDFGLVTTPADRTSVSGVWKTEFGLKPLSIELEYEASERLLHFSSMLSAQEERSNDRLRTTEMFSSQLQNIQIQSDKLFRIVDAVMVTKPVPTTELALIA